MIKSDKIYKSINQITGKLPGDLVAGFIAGLITAFNFGYLADLKVKVDNKNITNPKLAIEDYIIIISNIIDENIRPNTGFAWWIFETDETYILYTFKSRKFIEGFNKVFYDLKLNPSNFTVGNAFIKQVNIPTLKEFKIVPYYTGSFEVSEFDYE